MTRQFRLLFEKMDCFFTTFVAHRNDAKGNAIIC